MFREIQEIRVLLDYKMQQLKSEAAVGNSTGEVRMDQTGKTLYKLY